MHPHLTFFTGKSADLPCKTTLKKKARLPICHPTDYENLFLFKFLYTKLVTWSLNLDRDFIKRMMTLQWLLEVTSCLRSCDWEIRIEAILTLYCIDTHFDATTTDSFENSMGKGDTTRNEQFLLFLQCFQLNQIAVSPFVTFYLYLLLNRKSLILAYQVKVNTKTRLVVGTESVELWRMHPILNTFNSYSFKNPIEEAFCRYSLPNDKILDKTN